MPKRSNAFQAVVHVIHKALADESATVVESNMLADGSTGTLREVDITITSDLVGYPVTIGIECRDGLGAKKARAQDVSFIDDIRGKHESMSIDISVLVSSTGFTPQAEAKAASLGMLTLTPEELTEERARNLLHAGKEIYLWQTEYVIDTYILELKQCECHDRTTFQGQAGVQLFFSDGTAYAVLSDHIATVCRHMDGGAEAFFVGSSPHRFGFGPLFAPRHDGAPVELLYAKIGDALHEIDHVIISASSTSISAPVELRYGILKDFYYGSGDVTVGDERVTFMITKRDGEDSRPILRFNPKPRKKKNVTTHYLSEHEIEGKKTD